MNTRERILIVFSVFLSLFIQRVQANPNHLEPIPPYGFLDMDGTSEEYRQAVFTSLIGRGWLPSAWMIEKPSSSREYAVVVWRSSEHGPNDTHPGEIKRRQWVMEYVAPKEKIWRYKPESHDTRPPKNVGGRVPAPSLDIRVTKDVERHRVPITAELAKVVQEAWLSTLQLTRYAEGGGRGLGLDGTTLEFCCGDLFGQTWSPTTGLPAMLAGLGRKLSAVALSDEKNRDSLLTEADSLARKIAKDAEAEQIRLFGKKRRINVQVQHGRLSGEN